VCVKSDMCIVYNTYIQNVTLHLRWMKTREGAVADPAIDHLNDDQMTTISRFVSLKYTSQLSVVKPSIFSLSKCMRIF